MPLQVPNLFAKDEVMTIIEAVTPKAKRAGRGITPSEVYAFFVEQCRANLHMVLAMSPVGDAFRSATYCTLLPRTLPHLIHPALFLALFCCSSGSVLCVVKGHDFILLAP